MKLVHNWPAVLRHAWSLRFMFVVALLSGAEVALPLLDGVLPLSRQAFAAAVGLTTVAAIVARFVAQQPLNGGRNAQPPEKE